MSNRSLIIGTVVILSLGGLAALLMNTGNEAARDDDEFTASDTGAARAPSAAAEADSDSVFGAVRRQMLAVGEVAPDFTLERLDGGSFELSTDGRNRVVLLNFWATWCEPCQDEAADLHQLHEQLGDEGLVIVGVSLDEEGREAVGDFHAAFPVGYPLLLNGRRVAERYGAHYVVPTSFMIGRDGRIVDRYIGAVTRDQLASRLRSVLAG